MSDGSRWQVAGGSSRRQMVADGGLQVAVCGSGCGFELRWQPCCEMAVAYINGA